MAVRNRETFEPVTLGHIRGHGCRDILILLRLDQLQPQRDYER
jgi:hypothetical protein